MALFFPDLFGLAKTSHGVLKYEDVAAEKQHEVGEKYYKFSHGTASLYHREEAWDSRVFGMSVGKIEYVEGESAQDIDCCVGEFLASSPYQYIVIRISQTYPLWIQAFEQNGAMFLDSTVEMSCELSSLVVPKKKVPQVSLAHANDQQQILQLAEAFRFGRFFTDPEVHHGQEVYSEWLENSLTGKAADAVYVYKDDAGVVHGVATTKFDVIGGVKLLKIPLVVKSPSSELPGISQALLTSILQKAKKEHFQISEISTQGTNISAQRGYLAVGYRPYHCGITMRWKK